MHVSSKFAPKYRPLRRLSLAAGVVVAGMAVVAPSAGASTLTKTPLPTSCPTKSTVAAALHEKVSKATVSKKTSSRGGVKVCLYKTSQRVATEVEFVSPLTPTEFTKLRTVAKKHDEVVVLHGLGNAAWALKAGDGLFVLKGTLFTGIVAPHTSDAQLAGLARTIIKDLPAA